MSKEQYNSELNVCLLRHVISACNENDHQTLHEIGMDPALVERAKNMNAEVFTRLSNFRIAEVTIDSRRFGLMLDYVEQGRETNAITNKMIKLEASQAMLNKLVGIDPREFRERRKTLGMPNAFQGRPVDLDMAQSNHLYAVLRKHPEPDGDGVLKLNWYCLLSEETGLPLSKIWHHMKID